MVTISTVEIEYMAFTQATQQALWFTKFFNEVGLPTATPVVIHADNNGSISNSTNDKNYRQTKCVDIKQRIKLGQVTFNYIPFAENVADLFTKQLPRDATLKFVKALRLHKCQNE